MNILHICNYYMDGLGYQENYLPFEQEKRGNRVHIVTSDRFYPFKNYKDTYEPIIGPRQRQAINYTVENVRITRLRVLLEIKSRALVVLNHKPIHKLIEMNKIDIVHIHGATNLALLPLLIFKNKRRLKIFVDCHSDETNSATNSIPNKIYYSIWKILYKLLNTRISLFLPITNSSKYFLTDHLGIPTERQFISPLGSSHRSLETIELNRSIFRNKNKLNEYFVVMYSGKFSKEKKINVIVDIVAEVSPRIESKVLLMLIGAGSNEETQALERHIELRTSRLDNVGILRLPFLRQDELIQAYCGSDIGIWPGTASNSIQEVMSCSVPVLLGKSDATTHLLSSDHWLIQDDINVTAENIAAYINNSGNILEEKSAVFKFSRKHQWGEIAEELLLKYERS